MTYYLRYRVGTNPTPQSEKIQASGPNEIQRLLQARYPNEKIQIVNGPTSSQTPPPWFKG